MGSLGVLVGVLGMLGGLDGVGLALLVLTVIVMMGRLVMVKCRRLVMGRRTVMMVARSVLLFFLHRGLFKKCLRLGRRSNMPDSVPLRRV